MQEPDSSTTLSPARIVRRSDAPSRRLAAAAAGLMMGLTASMATAQDPPREILGTDYCISDEDVEGIEVLSDLTLDRIDDTSSVWRLSTYVWTELGAPSQPAPVYLQFGFMGCEPCETLAELANERLAGTNAERVYVHLDDILLSGYGGSNQRLWRDLWGFVQEAPYDTYTPIRRGNTDLMRSLCGQDANAPSSLLILPNGEIVGILNGADLDIANAAFDRLLAGIECDEEE